MNTQHRILFLSWLASAVWLIAGCTVEPEPAANLSFQKLGPHNRFVGRPAEYSITLSNLGTASAANVIVRDSVPAGMSYLNSNPPGEYDPRSRTVSWNLGTLNVGEGMTVGVTLRSDSKGQQCNTATIEADGGIRRTTRSCMLVSGVPELSVTIEDSPDPLEVGVTTTYTVNLMNQGTETATNTRLSAVLPPSLMYVSSTGPTNATLSGDTLTFAPLTELLPNQAVVYSVLARAVASHDSRFTVQLTADHLAAPVVVQESTRIGPAGHPSRAMVVPSQSPITRPGPTYLASEAGVSKYVRVDNLAVRGRTLTGRVVNQLSRPIHSVDLTIRSVWLWKNEFKPGADTLSRSTVYRLDGQVPPGGFQPFSFSPLPVSNRTDGHYETRVFVSGFTELP